MIETYGRIRNDGTLALEQALAYLPGRVRVRIEPIEAAESDEEFAKRFAQLAATWKQATAHMSIMARQAKHPAYQEIIAMGERAVPLILADLEKNGDHWFIALHQITGAEPPIPAEHKRELGPGWIDINGMQAAWIAWGREQGYRW